MYKLYSIICSTTKSNEGKVLSNFYENVLDQEIKDFKAKSKKVSKVFLCNSLK